jgi:hypothetical protein
MSEQESGADKASQSPATDGAHGGPSVPHDLLESLATLHERVSAAREAAEAHARRLHNTPGIPDEVRGRAAAVLEGCETALDALRDALRAGGRAAPIRGSPVVDPPSSSARRSNGEGGHAHDS